MYSATASGYFCSLNSVFPRSRASSAFGVDVRGDRSILEEFLRVVFALERVRVAMLHERLGVHLDRFLEHVLLHERVPLPRHRARDHLVVHAQLPALLDRVVAALDARVVVPLLEVHRGFVGEERDVIVVERDGGVVVLQREVKVLRLVRRVPKLLLSLRLSLRPGRFRLS